LPEGGQPPVSVEATRNVFAGRECALLFNQHNTAPLGAAEFEKRVRGVIAWQGQENVFAERMPLLRRTHKFKDLPGTNPLPAVTEWDAWWRGPDSRSVCGPVRFGGERLAERLLTEPGTLSARDFRLAADSAGKDLGADVDRVGPGPAYEEWR